MSLDTLQSPKRDVISRVAAAKKNVEADFPGIQYIDATAGVVCDSETGKPYVPTFYRNAARRLAETNSANSYNFAGDQEYLKRIAKLIFGENLDEIASWPASGGSHAIFLGNRLLHDSAEEFNYQEHQVITGFPTWPGHQGIIQNAGNQIVSYQHLDEHGEFEIDDLLGNLQEQLMISPDVSVLFHGVCQNPLGIDVPQRYWNTIAEHLKEYNVTLQIDLAYLGFGENIETDSAMIRYFREHGVKMMVYFSGSKFYNSYGESRIGAGYAVNYPNLDAIRDHALKLIRETTSAVPEHGQKLAALIEREEEFQGLHRQWLQDIRHRVSENRRIIMDVMRGQGFDYLNHSKGIFLQLPHEMPEEAAGQLFPELGQKMGWGRFEPHDDNYARVATVPVADEGVRLNIAALNSQRSAQVAEALGRVWQL